VRLSPRQVRVLRATLLPISLIVCLLLSSWGRSSIAASPFVTSGASRLVVREYSFADLASNVTVSNRNTITKIVNDLNALPLHPPHGPISCPADDGDVYKLTFYYSARGTEAVQVAASGCRMVQRKGLHLRWALPLKHQGLLGLLEQIVSSI
jgi:hypothetical protein